MDRVLKLIRQALNELADDISLGGAKDFAQYQHMVGTVNGLAIAERFIRDEMERKDDDFEE